MMTGRIAILTGALAAFALPGAPAAALDLNLGGISVSVGGNGGGGGGGGGRGGGVSASASVNLGGSSGLGAVATAGTGGVRTNAPVVRARATVDLNRDGIIDRRDEELLVTLDVNGDGVLDILDDVNGDGVISELDLRAAAAIDLGSGRGRTADVHVDLGVANSVVGSTTAEMDIGLGRGGGAGRIGIGTIGDTEIDIGLGIDIDDLLGGPGGGGGGDDGTVVPPGDIGQAVRDLGDDDRAALKRNCRTILANPAAFSPSAVAVCRIVAARL